MILCGEMKVGVVQEVVIRAEYHVGPKGFGKAFPEARKLLKEERFARAVEKITQKMRSKSYFNEKVDLFTCLVFPDMRRWYFEMNAGKTPHIQRVIHKDQLDDIDELLVHALFIAEWYSQKSMPTVRGFRKALTDFM